MILYDKKCNLLGMSRDVLGFLGYEDIEEFKTYTNDIADLFVSKSGYVYKFKNFSWIDYILHSGAPNKSALVKLKNGKEVESRIAIEEILLVDPIGENQTFYKVELFNNYLGESSGHPLQGSITGISAFQKVEEEPPVKEEESVTPVLSTPPSLEPSLDEDYSEEDESEDATFALTQDYSEEISVDDGDSYDEAPTQKLKLDDSMFMSMEEETVPEEETLPASFEEEPLDDALFSIAQEEEETEAFEPSQQEEEVQKLPLDDFADIALKIASYHDESSEKEEIITEEEKDEPKEDVFALAEDFQEDTTEDFKDDDLELQMQEPLVTETSIDEEELSIEESEEETEPTIQVKNDLAPDLIEEELETPSSPLIDQAIESITEDDWDVQESTPAPEEAEPKVFSSYQDRTYIDDFSETDIFGTYDAEENLEEETPTYQSTFMEEDLEEEPQEEIEKPQAIVSPKHPAYLNEAQEVLGLSQETLSSLMKEYLDHVDIVSHALEDALMQDDSATTNELVQQLKGVADNLRIASLSDVLGKITHATPQNATELFAEYQKIVQSLKEELA